MNLKELVTKVTGEVGMTAYQMAIDLGVSTSTVLNWKNEVRTKCFLSMKRKLEAKYDVVLADTVLASHKRGKKLGVR